MFRFEKPGEWKWKENHHKSSKMILICKYYSFSFKNIVKFFISKPPFVFDLSSNELKLI